MGGKSTWPDRNSNPGPLAYRASSLTTELPSHPCLNRSVPESARNRDRSNETVPLLLAARARTHTEPPNVKGEEKTHSPTGSRTKDLSHTVRALWPLSYWVTRSTCDNFPLFNKIRLRIWSEPCRNRRDSLFAARSLSTDSHWATICHRGGISTYADPGPLAYHASTLSTDLLSHTIELWHSYFDEWQKNEIPLLYLHFVFTLFMFNICEVLWSHADRTTNYMFWAIAEAEGEVGYP